MLLEHRRVLEEAGWEVRVCGTVAQHEVPVEQIAVHTISPRLSAYEYYWRFVRANPVGVLLAYDEPGVAMLAPSRSIVRFSWTARLPRYWQTRWALRRFRKATYLFPSHAAAASWRREHKRISPNQTQVIWNGVDLDLFRPFKRDGNRCRVGFAGQWTVDKGLEVLMAAWELVHSQIPQAELRLAGGPDLWQRNSPLPPEKVVDPGMIERMEGSGVKALGVLPRDQMPSFWSEVDLACVPSVCEEQFGLVALEAMACGVPLVVSNSGALPEIIGDAGLVVPKGDHVALAGAILELLQSPERLLSLSARARARATLFNRQDRAQELLQLVERVSSGNH